MSISSLQRKYAIGNEKAIMGANNLDFNDYGLKDGYIEFIFDMNGTPEYNGLSVLVYRDGSVVSYNLLEDVVAYLEEHSTFQFIMYLV